MAAIRADLLMRSQRPDELETRGVEARVLARGPWQIEAGRGISVTIRPRPFDGGRRRNTVHDRAEVVWRRHLAQGRPTYGRPPEPPGLLRLSSSSDLGSRGLHLVVQPTWYFTLLGTNVAAESTEWTLPPSTTAESLDLSDLASSELANPLTVNLAIVAGSGRNRAVLIQRRGVAVANAAELYQVSAAGYVDNADALLPAGAVWGAAIREAGEETGIQLEPTQIVWLTLCRMTRRFFPGLCGVAHVEEFPELRTSPDHDASELDGLEWWPWDPQAIASRVHDAGGWRRFVPLGAAALLAALASDFGELPPSD